MPYTSMESSSTSGSFSDERWNQVIYSSRPYVSPYISRDQSILPSKSHIATNLSSSLSTSRTPTSAVWSPMVHSGCEQLSPRTISMPDAPSRDSFASDRTLPLPFNKHAEPQRPVPCEMPFSRATLARTWEQMSSLDSTTPLSRHDFPDDSGDIEDFDLDSDNFETVPSAAGRPRGPSLASDNDKAVRQATCRFLSEICSEAARRKWAEEVTRRLAVEVTTHDGTNIGWTATRSKRARRNRHAPYSRAGRPATDYRRTSSGRYSLISDINNTSASSNSTEVSSQDKFADEFTRLVSLISNATWTNARRAIQDPHLKQAAAVEEMSVLYALSVNILQGMKALDSGAVKQHTEEDLITECRAFCRYLGYEHGAARCGELLNHWYRKV